MNISKNFKSKSYGRQLLILLSVLMLVFGLFSAQTPKAVLADTPIGGGDDGMGDDGPIDVDPIDPQLPPFQAPANGFSWEVPRRFGFNYNTDGMINYHWDSVSMTYDPNYIFPESWPARFIGCQTEADADFAWNNTPNTYTWRIVGVSTTTVHQCIIYLNFPAQGTYHVQMEVRDPSGNVVPAGKDPAYFEQEVTIKDYFIVSIGDSLASGEGNPDIEMWATANIPPFGWTERSPAVWQDKRCHRSAKTGAAMAALALEGADPHTSVTFISFACSGATINTPTFDGGDPAKHQGTGILGPYRGAETNVPFSDTFQGYIPAQMDQLRTALANRPAGRPERRIDALTISAGGNDIHFGDIVRKCVEDGACWSNSKVKEDPHSNTEYGLYELVARALKTNFVNGEPSNSPTNVPDGFDVLADQIDELSPAAPAHIYLTQYMDQTRDDNGDACLMLDDIYGWLDKAIVPSESEIASWFATRGLNDVLLAAAQRHKDRNWQFVDGITSYNVDPLKEPNAPGQFVRGPDGKGHGYCASYNWIRRADESQIIQGPVDSRANTRGTLHPNYRGHEVYKERILRYMLPDLLVDMPGQAPTFSSSFSSAGLTNQPGENGWYVQSCDSQDVCFPKVVLQAVAVSNTAMNGASILVNDKRGCNGSSVICNIAPSPDAKQLTYAVEINASGIYRFQFTAQDSNGRVSFLQQEIKVDLEDPVLATPIGPFEVDEGSSVVVSATMATTPEGVVMNDDAVVNYDWDLDNDGIFETTDEQPTFSAEELNGPTDQTIQVLVTDRAGRTATAQAAVNVLNVVPDPVINEAPVNSNEGSVINLTSTVIGAAQGDIYTYAWEVKKDGEEDPYACGTNANFSFTPDDNGSYEVSLDVTDEDSDVGTASQTIAVTNVAPALSNLSVPSTGVSEGASFTLSGDITEPGTADTLALTIDWGDGSAELLSLPAGSTSFSRSHTYADDNPTGTASDDYLITLSIADDDAGTDTGSVSVAVNNLAPSLSISAPENGALYAVKAAVNLNASLTDPSSLDDLTCSINWGDGANGSGTLAAGACMASHTYAAAGVYTVRVIGMDDDTGAKTESVMVVVYDPSAGFVTGGGWMYSPTGAYKGDETLAGKATFGVVSKYQKGANVPTGNTAFEFEVGVLEFHSTAYEWLVVNQGGTNAQFKGSGLINGALDPNGNAYKFMLWAGDGSHDTFRIRLWWEDTNGEQYDVYDNGAVQPIGGGNIVVHTGK